MSTPDITFLTAHMHDTFFSRELQAQNRQIQIDTRTFRNYSLTHSDGQHDRQHSL